MLSVLFRCLALLLGGALLPLALVAQVSAQPSPVPAAPPVPNLSWLNEQLRTSPVLRQHQVGLSLADAGTGQPLFGYQDSRYFTPASTTKLLTLYAGLTLLAADPVPGLRYVQRGPDTLLFWGTGDPMLLHGDVPARRVYDFLKSRPEKVLLYAQVPTPPAFGPGWSWDDYGYYFQPERSPLPIYGNTVRFYGRPAPAAPRVLPRFFRPLTAPAPGTRPNPAADHVQRTPEENRFFVFPSAKGWVDEVPFRTSPALLLQLLQDTLRRPVLAAGPLRLRPRDSVRTLRTLPPDSLYRRMLRVSDNFLAEQLLLLCAATLTPDSLSPARVIRTMQQNYLRTLPDQPQWVDGSGLSRLNLFTPRFLTALLVRLHQQVPEPQLLSWLAAGGGQGTLRRGYLPTGKTGPWLWGKTGTLTNNHNLAGYLRTRSGRLVAFSFFNNNYVRPTREIRREMERLLTRVRDEL
ncbi:D-alanyl-D-alanine carboxypeptidase [Hymenobacter sp. ISL-91]|uniref:D-alanyl-D-alanine carboxypeptidase n=1 Tax=Hymenobacter sp. ISL-91 TaxID=2819151 RepID=UPI001BE88B97|nr:D-alanyl-D-alanine carboxypeptidase [Hymenobacter sp. ISL-91]MBT2557936.1 D-alanyl-D-alanine carboxypeptidase [Hymenobacter sp. ISL-91]